MDEFNRFLDEAILELEQEKGRANPHPSNDSPTLVVEKQKELEEDDSNKDLPPLKKLAPRPKPTTEDTAGSNWFNMQKPEMTAAIKRDLKILEMRRVLEPTRFYKAENFDSMKYFAIGTIKEDPTEFYSGRISRKQRETSLAAEILSTKKDFIKSRHSTLERMKKHTRKVKVGRRHHRRD